MSGKDSKKRAHEVFERLNKLGRSPIVVAAREFELAGLIAETGSCYFHAGLRDFRSIELVVSKTTRRKEFLFTIHNVYRISVCCTNISYTSTHCTSS